MFIDKRLESKLNKNRGTQPFRSELFNLEQLGGYAQTLAAVQQVGEGTRNNYLRERLDENEHKLEKYNSEVRAVIKSTYITPATEWVVDNFYLIEEHVQLARRHFPKSYSKELPYLLEGPYKKLPRIYGLIVEYVSHVDAQVDEESLIHFFRAYQEKTVLKLGELWAVPIMLRLALIENLRRIVVRLQQDQKDRLLANEWMDRVEATSAKQPSALIGVVSDMAKSDVPISSAFVSTFTKRLSQRNPSLQIVRNWFDQRLQDEGFSSEELVRIETQNQAADQVSVSHSIKSFRFINSEDWRDFVEALSIVEKTLRTDPVDVYSKMDFTSRDHYRHVVEQLARKTDYTEDQVARLAVELAENKSGREAHVGYYLVEDGLQQLKTRVGLRKNLRSVLVNLLKNYPLTFYLGLTALLIALVTFTYVQIGKASEVPVTDWRYIMLSIFFLVFISQFAFFLVNYLSTLLIRPDILPRLDFSDGIPEEYCSVVVIPTLLTSKKNGRKLVSDLEIHYLANKDKQLRFILLTDFPDADVESSPGDDSLIEYVRLEIEEMNRKYTPDSPFYLFHRPRRWNPEEKKWMGYERKRGKLMAFNAFLLDGSTDTFSTIAGDLSALQGITYVVTLDTDTQLSPCSIHKLVGTMAHTLNHPVIDPERNIVIKGYGILQPRVAILLRSSQASRFSRMFTDEVGIDPYTRSVSNVYQDIFHEGSFVGKGIYDLKAFEKVLACRFPENKILSHDLLESTYVRSGLIGDVEIYESFPSAYEADIKRRHRWMRGDWQIIQWLLPRVPTLHQKEQNPLSGLSKWKIADNLRRGMVPPLTLLLIWGFFIWFPQKVWIVLLLLVIIALLPFIFTFPVVLLKKPKEVPWRFHILEILKKSGHQIKQILFSIVTFPYDAYVCTDAMVRSLWRLLISHKHMLQWQTAEEAEFTTDHSLKGYYRQMWFSPAFAIACFLLISRYPEPLLYALPLLLVWVLAPWIAWFVSRPVDRKAPELSQEQSLFLRRIARKTWYFFETFVNDQDSWLPPDNYQEVPEPVIATRTSPTNIGLSLLANLAARDMGYLSVSGVIERTNKTFFTLDKLKKYRGHFYNWYDTRTLEALYPLYISTVDSGNLAGNLITLNQGLTELIRKPVYDPGLFDGLLDGIRIMRSMDPANNILKKTEETLLSFCPDTIQAALDLLNILIGYLDEWQESSDTKEKVLADWGKTIRNNCKDHYQDLSSIFPWLIDEKGPFANYITGTGEEQELNEYISGLLRQIPTLEEVSRYGETVCREIERLMEERTVRTQSSEGNPYYTFWVEQLEQSAQVAKEKIRQLSTLASHSARLAQMDFTFLYQEKKKLFTIGYNLVEQRFDESSYDMLASEARLGSYIAIAQRQVPLEHWFYMSRLVVVLKNRPVLLSWTGSMFEYLMPLLLMPGFQETLLSSTYLGAVAEQEEYGRKQGVPWGISESGYNRPDTQFNYQYQAFGVPTLGLKRGLYKDLVIAPYATMLALMVDPRRACENMQRLSAEGREGGFGYYEAVDYTPSHLPINEKSVTIFSFMAHHQGMGLLSMVNYLKENSMQKRFMASPEMKAFELLMQEKVPHTITTEVITEHSKLGIEDLNALRINDVQIDRIYQADQKTQEVNLLSNGRYQLMLNSNGAGYSRWDNLAITRWRVDPTSDCNGLFIYIRDKETGKYGSIGCQPVPSTTKEYEVHFTQAYAEYHQRYAGLDITTNICVSPEDDVELRCVKLVNHTHKTKEIELTTYGEVVIAPAAADEAHPVFSNLFVQTSFDPELSTLFCTRRPRSEEEHPPHLFHLMQLDHTQGGEVTFETDRSRFVGRGNTLAAPFAMKEGTRLSGTEGFVLDPVISLRRTVIIPPGKRVRVCIVLGISETQQSALELAEKYQNIRMTDRAFDLAWTHSQVVLYHLNIREAEAQLYQRLAGSLIYMNPAFRAEPTVLKNNRKGQNGLWGYGISGDIPLVIIRISHASGMELVRQMVLAHAYWRMKGLTVEMMILNEDLSIYRHPLLDDITNLISSGVEGPWLNKAGGIFVRPVEQVPSEDLILLQSTASMIFSDRDGSLQEQIEQDKTFSYSQARLIPQETSYAEDKVELSAADLLFDNGYGGFTKDGKEYVITLYPGQATPAPWSNVMANPMFGTVVTESGSAYTWYENSHEYRLTPWYNDPVKDTTGEAIYIRDEQTGTYWSPTPLPAGGKTPYRIRHGFGYTVFEHTEQDITSELWIYVAIDAPVKFSVLRLKNLSGNQRRISVTGYYEWVLGDTRTRNLLHIQTQTDPRTGVLYAQNSYNTDFQGKIAFIDAGQYRAVTGDRREFLGKDGTLAAPEAMRRKRLSGNTGAGPDPCGVVQVFVDLRPKEGKAVRFVLGCAQNEGDMSGLIGRFRQPGMTQKALQDVREYWQRTLNTVHVETPDAAVNIMSNGWLLYQTLSCRIWGRTGFYQSGGAFGFRDQLQDVMALTYAEPVLMRQQILLAARHQFKKGDVQHWWHPPTDRGVRTHFSDDYLWLPYVTHYYVTTLGDTGILDEMIPFIEGRELQVGEESYYDQPMISDETASLYEHCVRSIRYGLKFGIHGLPLMGCGDWNDGMNLVGIEGKGESVWLAFFLYDVLIKFATLADQRNDTDFASYCRVQARQLQENIRQNAWDGNWYLRAYFDNGTPLGSVKDSECMIDTLPQSWSVISQAGDPERSQQAMEEVNRRLVDRENRIIRLFTPSFDTFTPSPGYIKGYIPGVRENGGQYTHGTIWTILAFALMGETDRAWELFDLLNPVYHGDTKEHISVYKVEPYVIAADVYSAVQHPGRGGWTWYTGSSAWMYRLLTETLLGVNRVGGDKLRLTPHMRSNWDQYTVNYRYYDTVYHILFKRVDGVSGSKLVLDGKELSDPDIIPLVNDQIEHTVEKWIIG